MRQKRAQKVSKENQGYVAPNEERREFFFKKKTEVVNGGKCYREVDEEGRLPLSMVVSGKWWTPGNS